MVTAKLTVPILIDWKSIESYMAQHDIVEVVRCKDCKHKYYDENQLICQKLYFCDGNNFEPSAESFCSQGERKETDGAEIH